VGPFGIGLIEVGSGTLAGGNEIKTVLRFPSKAGIRTINDSQSQGTFWSTSALSSRNFNAAYAFSVNRVEPQATGASF
jgi:hypothetical protein